MNRGPGPLTWESRQTDEYVIIWQLRCNQWWKIRQHDNLSIQMISHWSLLTHTYAHELMSDNSSCSYCYLLTVPDIKLISFYLILKVPDMRWPTGSSLLGAKPLCESMMTIDQSNLNIWIRMRTFSWKKNHLNLSFAKWCHYLAHLMCTPASLDHVLTLLQLLIFRPLSDTCQGVVRFAWPECWSVRVGSWNNNHMTSIRWSNLLYVTYLIFSML